MENTLLKSRSRSWLKRKIKARTNEIYKGQKVAPVYRVWQTEAGQLDRITSWWFARQIDTVKR